IDDLTERLRAFFCAGHTQRLPPVRGNFQPDSVQNVIFLLLVAQLARTGDYINHSRELSSAHPRPVLMTDEETDPLRPPDGIGHHTNRHSNVVIFGRPRSFLKMRSMGFCSSSCPHIRAVLWQVPTADVD